MKTKKKHPTEVLIEDARKLLRPSEVRLHRVPGWLRSQLAKTIGCGGYNGEEALRRAMAATNSTRVFDHWGSTVINGGKAFVSEPYPAGPEQMTAAIRFAEAADLDLFVSANSWWFPSQTIRFIFKLKE